MFNCFICFWLRFLLLFYIDVVVSGFAFVPNMECVNMCWLLVIVIFFSFVLCVYVWILMKWIQSFIVLTREIQVSKLLVDYTLLFSFFLWNRMLVSLLLIFCYASHRSAAKCKVRLKSFIVMATSDCSTRLRMYQSISQYSNLWSKSLFEQCLEYGR